MESRFLPFGGNPDDELEASNVSHNAWLLPGHRVQWLRELVMTSAGILDNVITSMTLPQHKSVERKTVCCTIMMLMTAFGILAPFYGAHGKLGVANGGKMDMVVKAGIRVRHPHRS